MLKNRLTYLAVLLGAALFFVCYNGYISHYVFLVTLALPWISLLVSLPGIFGVRLTLSVEAAEVNKGQSVPLQLTIDSRLPFVSGRAYVTLHTHNTLTGETQDEYFTFTASPKAMTVVHQLSSPCCGQVLCELRRGKVCDYMGIFSFPLSLSRCPQYQVTFYPAVYQPELSVEQVFLPGGEGERYSHTKPGDDPSELFDLREYREGDKISRIHWKLSQKSGALLVKEFGLPISDHILFVLDVNGTNRETDLLLDIFATLSHYLSRHGVSYQAAFWEENQFCLESIPNEEAIRPVLGQLLKIGKNDARKAVPAQALPRGASHILYLCCVPDGSTASSLQQQLPNARLSILLASESPDKLQISLPPRVELTTVKPGQIMDALNGFHL